MKRKPPAPSTGPGPGGMDGDRPYLAAADLLRVFSVGLVAWFHIWQQSWLNPGFSVLGTWVDLQRLVRRGYMMVDLLLLLSGFLLYLPCARRRSRGGAPLPDVPKFYRRRLARILPSYLLAMGVGTALLLGSAPAPGSPPLWKDLLTHLTFTYTFFADTYLWTNLNGALWTLAVEMQFYLLFPLAARLFARRPWRTWAGMTALALLCRWGVAQMAVPTLWINQLPCMLDLYAFGMLAAHLLAAGPGPVRRSWAWAAASLACLLAVGAILWAQNPADNRDLQGLQLAWRLPLALAGSGFLYCGAWWPAGLARAVGNPVTRFLAGISYNFYIWHQYLAVKLKQWHIPPYVSELPQQTEGRLWQLRYTWIWAGLALVLAVLATELVEKPGGRLLDPARGKGRPPAGAGR